MAADWETIRWPGETGKMLFHPRPDRPTEPNAGILRLEPGAHHPLHYHDFAQVWYVLEGTFRIGDRECGPGTMIFHRIRTSKTSSVPKPARDPDRPVPRAARAPATRHGAHGPVK